MIRITVELVSAVHPSRNRLLGVAQIVNDGRGTPARGNYTVTLSKAGQRTGETWRRGYVEGFDRKRRGGWDLLFLALRACVGSRNLGDFGLAPAIAEMELPTLEEAVQHVRVAAARLDAKGHGPDSDRALLRLSLELMRTLDLAHPEDRPEEAAA